MAHLPDAMEEWLQYLEANKRYSAHTLQAYRQDLKHLLASQPDKPLRDMTEADIRRAVAQLHSHGYKPRSLARALSAWRGFYQWWAPRAELETNPVATVRPPKAPRQLPRALSVEQAQALLDRPSLPPPHTPLQLRDQAMFEILYSSGLRLAELVSLDWRYVRERGYESTSWLQLDDAEVHIQGKGGKRRTVPLGGKAIDATRQWLGVRHQFLKNDPLQDSKAALFLGVHGARMTPPDNGCACATSSKTPTRCNTATPPFLCACVAHPLRHASCNCSWTSWPPRRGCRYTCIRTACATALPAICCNPPKTCAPCKNF